MPQPAPLPGVRFLAVQPERQPSSLRTDIAAFVGRARRGPVGGAVRIEGWPQFERVFGGVAEGALLPYAVRGYFENGGEIAYVTRTGVPPHAPASAAWQIGATQSVWGGIAWQPGEPAEAGFAAAEYEVVAASPGTWGNAIVVDILYRRDGVGGAASLDFRITVDGVPEETFRVPPENLSESLQEASALIRATPTQPQPQPPPNPTPGPTRRSWRLRLTGGADPGFADLPAYETLIDALVAQAEPALFVFPDLHSDLPPASDPLGISALGAVLARFAEASALRLDRLAIIDLPQSITQAHEAQAWLAQFPQSTAWTRTVTAYHPWVRVPAPPGAQAEPLRTVPPGGHVAGLISRLDRERGAYLTPANAELREAVDVEQPLDLLDGPRFSALGINQVRCFAGRGLLVWGGRMLNPSVDETVFIAHRRLIHRLVRAIRRVADPLVFENNGPDLWYSLVRGITTILLEAFRAGALRGARPEEAFRVRCDDSLNPPSERDAGRLTCEIDVAPAAPMEFITLRVAFSVDGTVEVQQP
ncbi:MAG: hypothetical protein U1E38_06215 [Rhodospirillales bacterium]